MNILVKLGSTLARAGLRPMLWDSPHAFSTPRQGEFRRTFAGYMSGADVAERQEEGLYGSLPALELDGPRVEAVKLDQRIPTAG